VKPSIGAKRVGRYPAVMFDDSLSPEDQLAILTDGIDTVMPQEALLEKLRLGRPLRVKLGVDPTAPDVTLGWAVVFRLLRRFQDLGHTAVLILGDFTALVGDPSGKSETRQRLSTDDVAAYAASCLDMIKDVLSEERLEIRPNSEWLGTMDMHQLLELTSTTTVARLLERDDFAKRFAAQQPISLIEFMYPILQAMDSVAVQADVELGGADQLWNLLMGRQVQVRFNQEPQVAVTVPLLVGTDGSRKMSQSYGNYISIREDANEMFGKVMSLPDDSMEQWFLLAAGYSEVDASRVAAEVRDGTRHPGETKRLLARQVVEIYHGNGAATEAESAFDRQFKQHAAPENIDELTVPDSMQSEVFVPALLAESGLVSSNSEGRRMIKQGAVKLDGERIDVERLPTAEVRDKVLQVGKRRFIRIV
jgi:tyrosyl-tRNA synthetase